MLGSDTGASLFLSEPATPPKLLIIYNKHLICSSIKLGAHWVMSALMVQSKQNNGGLVPEKTKEMSGPHHREAENLIFNKSPVTFMEKKKRKTTCLKNLLHARHCVLGICISEESQRNATSCRALKLKKVGKTTRLFRYDLNQIPYDYTVEVTNRFKGLDLIECLKNSGQRFMTLYRRQWSGLSPRKRNAKRQNDCLRRPYK